MVELKPWDTLYLDLIGPYTKYIIQQHPGDAIINNNGTLTWMMMIDPATGWFEIFEVPTFELDDITVGNDEYIDKSSQFFNNTRISRYLSWWKVVVENGSDFK